MGQSATLAANATTSLGDSGAGAVSVKVMSFTPTTWTGNITIVGRRVGSGEAWRLIPYRKRFLNGAVGDDSYVSTTITGDSLIEVNAAGLEIGCTVAGYAAGSMAVTTTDLHG